ncbi:hypothetical protein AC628_00925 [Bradyrhizobium sp. NAS96.2]|nr:hypothetical protein AC628_00925 [Bradyrhizobium sp. NAS96.2]
MNRLTSLGDKCEIVVTFASIGFTKKEADGMWQGILQDVEPKPVKICRCELNRFAIEVLGRATPKAVEPLHPAVEVRMLAPIVQFCGLSEQIFVIDRL